MILDVTPIAADPEDSKMTYDEYLAQKARVDDDVNRQTREVIVDEENFVKVKQFQKEEEATFFDSVKAAPKQRDESESAAKKGKKKNVISLDEFVGVSGPVASTETGEREGVRGGRGGGRGGAFGARGGRGGFRPDGERREVKIHTGTYSRGRGRCMHFLSSSLLSSFFNDHSCSIYCILARARYAVNFTDADWPFCFLFCCSSAAPVRPL